MVNKHHQFPKEADKSFHGSSSASFLLGEQDDQIDGPWKSTQKNFKYLWLDFRFPILDCKRNQLLTPHFLTPHDYLITFLARASTFGGIVSPRALAVWRLITSSTSSTVSTFKSRGWTPERTR